MRSRDFAAPPSDWRFYERLLDGMADGCLVVRGWQVSYVNRRLLALTGYSRDELLGRSFLRLVVPRRRERARRFHRRRLTTGGRAARWQGALRTRDGTEVPVELTCRTLTFRGARLVCYLVHDVRARLRLQAELQRLEDFQTSLLRHASLPIIAVDLRGRIVFFNEAAERLSGIPAEEALGKADFWRKALPDSALRRRVLGETIATMRQGRDTAELEIPLRTPGGDERLLAWCTTILRDSRGSVVGGLGVGRDVTDLRRAERALERRRRQVQAFNTISREIVLADDLDGVLRTVPQVLCERVGADAVTLVVPDTLGAPARFFFGGDVPASVRKINLQTGLAGARLSRSVIRTGKPKVARDLRRLKPRPVVRAYARAGFRSGVIVPVVGRQRTLGALAFISKTPDHFTEDVDFLTTLGRELGLIIEHGLLVRQLAQRERHLDVLNRAIRVVALAEDLEAGLQAVPRVLRELVESRSAILFLREWGGQPQAFIDGSVPPAVLRAFSDPSLAGAPVTRQAIQTAEPIIIDDLRGPLFRRHFGRSLLKYRHLSIMVVPVMGRTEVLGTLEFGALRAGHFTRADQAFLTTAAREVGLVIEYRLIGRQLADREQRLAALSSELARTAEEERHHVAALLHDDLGQLLSLARVQIDLAGRRLENPDRVAAGLGEAGAHIDAALAGVRRLAGRLEPEILADFEVVEALRKAVRDLNETQREGLLFTLRGSGPRPAPDVERALFRISMEAIQNALRHARARTIRVRATWRSDRLTISVRDDGRGFQPRGVEVMAAGLGLRLMRDRAQEVGADFEVRSGPGKGTLVRVAVPLAANGGDTS